MKMRAGELGQLSFSLARLLKGGVSLLRALKVLEEAFQSKTAKVFLKSIREQASQGRSLSDAMASFPQSVPAYFVQTLKAGEISGNTAQVLEELSLYLEKQESLKQKVMMAAAYPLFIVAAGIATLGVLGKFVFPKIMGIYDDFGGELPGLTKMVLALSPCLFPAAVLLFTGLAGMAWYLRQNGRWAGVLLAVPWVRGIFRAIILIRVSRLAGIMLESGIVILETVQMMERTFEIKRLRCDLALLKSKLTQGLTLSQGLAGADWVDPISRMLIMSAEESGELADTLNRIAKANEAQLEMTLQTAMKLMEPCLILAVGLVVGLMVAAMILPIFEIGNLVA